MAGKKSNTPMVKVANTRTPGVTVVSDVIPKSTPLSDKERMARKKVAALAGGFGSSKTASFYGSGDVSMGSGGNWYSPQLSTDFLEKPQNLRERRAWYRHFYNSTEIIGAAIDLHSTIPLSKIKLQKPKAKNEHLAEYSYRFFDKMSERLKMLRSLSEISHEFWLIGNCHTFAEDHNPYDGLSKDARAALEARGKAQSDMLLKEYRITDTDPNYIGWRKLIILPPDQVRVTKIPFADNPLIEYLPDPETKAAITRFEESGGDAFKNLSKSSRPDVPEEIREQVSRGGTIPLEQDPNAGSFVFHFARKKSQYETNGVSILERCVNTLLVKDKLRQAQTSIASRHMTPIRVVTAEDLSEMDVEDLRSQIDMALMDPDYSIVANYQISWEEYGSNQRLLDLSAEFERYDSDLYAGLGVTKEMMTGEASYSGSKITLELLNIQYLLFRDMLQEYIEKYLFEPVARRKGFVETDKYGNEKVIYPKISFARLSIRDNDSVFDQLMQLYNKGSVPIEDIYDLIGIDSTTATARLKSDLLSVNDSAFNDLVRGVYQAAANEMPNRTDIMSKLATALGVTYKEPTEEAGGEAAGGGGGGLGGLRFASDKAQKIELESLLASDPEGVAKVIKFLKSRQAPVVKVNGID